MSYTAQWRTAVLVGLLVVAIGAIQTAGPAVLGIPPVVFQWLGIAAIVLAAAQAMLPKVQSIPEPDYDARMIADRIGRMTAAEREQLLSEIEARQVIPHG